MPHQCLTCGETFADGSTDLLQGCPSCEGTRFFYTEEALEADEREELKEQTEDDVESTLREIVEGDERPDMGEDIWSREAWEAWIRLKSDEEAELPEKAKQALEGDDLNFEQVDDTEPDLGAEDDPAGDPDAEPEVEPATDAEPADDDAQDDAENPVQVELGDVEETAPPTQDAGDAPAAGAEPTIEEAVDPEDRPSTLNISGPGEYEIDVERLMEDSPVIVERDGSFMIHLPSVFDKED